MAQSKALIEAFAKILENPTLPSNDYAYYKKQYDHCLKAVNHYESLVELLTNAKNYIEEVQKDFCIQDNGTLKDLETLLAKIEKG